MAAAATEEASSTLSSDKNSNGESLSLRVFHSPVSLTARKAQALKNGQAQTFTSLITSKHVNLMKKSVLLLIVGSLMTLSSQAQKFALIDMEYILQYIPAYEQAVTQLDADSKKYQDEVEALGREAKTLYENYQKEAEKLTAAQRTERENAIVAKEKEAAELRQQYFGPQGILNQQQQQLMQPINDDIYEAVKAISLQRGYSLVLDRASDTSIIFASPAIDISNEVLSRLGYSN